MLFCNVDVLDEGFILKRGRSVGTRDGMIDYIGPAAPDADYGERYDGRHRLLLPGFCRATQPCAHDPVCAAMRRTSRCSAG